MVNFKLFAFQTLDLEEYILICYMYKNETMV